MAQCTAALRSAVRGSTLRCGHGEHATALLALWARRSVRAPEVCLGLINSYRSNFRVPASC